MKKILSAVSFILALVLFTGCQSTKKPTETNEQTNIPKDSIEQTTACAAKQSKENNDVFLDEAAEVSQILLKYAFPIEKVLESGATIDKAYFPRIANYMVYNYMCAAFSSTIKGKSELYSDFVSYSPEDQKAVVSRDNMDLLVYRLFGIDSIPATLISSEEFIDEKNQFEFSSKEPEKIGVDYYDLKLYLNEDQDIIADFKIKGSPKAHGFYRIVFSVMEESGNKYLRFDKLYQL